MALWQTLAQATFGRWPFTARPNGDIPTAHFYFLNAVADLVADQPRPLADRPIHRLGPYTFAANDRLIVIRYITEAELRVVGRRNWRSVDYVIDDMLPSADALAGVPDDYAARLRRFTTSLLPRIMQLGPRILAPSQPILDLFPDSERQLIDPCIPVVYDTQTRLAHHHAPGPRRLCFLGTRSHVQSLPIIEALALALGRQLPDVRLTLFFGRHLPPALAACPAIDNRQPLSWPAFRAFVDSARFHIAVAPLPPSSFNAGRSITKILDHATVGAAGVYSDRPPFSTSLDHGRNGLLLGDAPEAWIDTVVRLATSPDKALQLARAGIELANRRGDPDRLRRFWLERLQLHAPPRNEVEPPASAR